MRERVVAVIGAGSLRCGALTLASLASWKPDDIVYIRLFDANEERLDLFDLFLRRCLEVADTTHSVSSYSILSEPLMATTDVIITLHEDCARRMAGRMSPELYSPPPIDKLSDQILGDFNRPTPPEKLSLRTQQILCYPKEKEESRSEIMAKTLDQIQLELPAGARVMNLVRDVEYPTPAHWKNLDWPESQPEDVQSRIPHQVLRWIHGEESLRDYIQSAQDSPIYKWLIEGS